MKLKSTIAVAAMFLTSASWAGCQFNWESAGDTRIHSYIGNSIGGRIPDKFCPYAKNYKIVLITDAFALGKGCAGYASASLVKMNSSKLPKRRTSNLVHNVQCNGVGDAQVMTVESALNSVDNLMDDLDSHVKSANELN